MMTPLIVDVATNHHKLTLSCCLEYFLLNYFVWNIIQLNYFAWNILLLKYFAIAIDVAILF